MAIIFIFPSPSVVRRRAFIVFRAVSQLKVYPFFNVFCRDGAAREADWA